MGWSGYQYSSFNTLPTSHWLYTDFLLSVWWVPACLPFCTGVHGWVVRIFQPKERSPSWSWLPINWKLLVVLRHPTSTLRLSCCLWVLGGRVFSFDIHFIFLWTFVALITAVEFRFLFSLFHGRVKRQITSHHFICYILLFFSLSWSVSHGHKVTDHILFGVPGTILNWIFRHKAVDPRKIKMFVLDEADVMIAIQGHQDQSIRIHK